MSGKKIMSSLTTLIIFVWKIRTGEGNPVFIYLDAFCKPEHFEEFLPEYKDLDELKAHTAGADLAMLKLEVP